MRVIVTGGTGLIGRALTDNLIADGHQVIWLSRSPDRAGPLPPNVQAVKWDARTAEGWGHLADGVDAIVNLAGESIAGEGFLPQRWTAEKRRRIRQSRLNAGQAVVEAVTAAAHKPAFVIQSSAIGYYGTDEQATFTESDTPGDDLLADITVGWEASTDPLEEMGVRRAVARIGVVFSAEEGALTRLMLPFKFFVGGPLGNGRQWISWIHIDDTARALRFLLDHPSASGPYNLTAPNPVRNQELARALGEVMGRPSFIPVPGFAMRAAFGEVATVVLEGQRVLPERPTGAGFAFKYSTLRPALQNLLGK